MFPMKSSPGIQSGSYSFQPTAGGREELGSPGNINKNLLFDPNVAQKFPLNPNLATTSSTANLRSMHKKGKLYVFFTALILRFFNQLFLILCEHK